MLSARGNGWAHGGSTMKPNAPSYERLEQTITLIARHAHYPGKDEIVADFLREIDGR
jgi:hypothetical protein